MNHPLLQTTAPNTGRRLFMRRMDKICRKTHNFVGEEVTLDKKRKTMATKRIPYGISDFRLIAEENYYYVDKTRFIEQVEQAPPFLFLIRPRRFGKSLWLTMLSCYYDIAMKDDFDRLFENLYIGQHPTSKRNSYLILRFNFAMVNPEIDSLRESFEIHASACFKDFNMKYAHLLGEDYLKGYAETTNAESRLEYIALRCEQANLPIYLIIDEYDNFTNVALTQEGYERQEELERKTNFFCFFFKKIKGMTTGSGAAVRRIFIAGVSPVTLNDVTSGFNIAQMITTNPRFNEILGFTENEVREMLEYYKTKGCWKGDTEQMLGVMRAWYGNYCFSEECREVRLYNPTLVLYLVEYLTRMGEMPDSLEIWNVNIDYGKLRHLIAQDKRLGGNFSHIWRIAKDGEIAMDIVPGFPAEEIADNRNFISLLFYFGQLTIDRVERGKTVLKIPNLTIRQILFSYIEQGYSESGLFKMKVEEMDELLAGMAYDGEWRPVFEYFAGEVREQLGIRDFLQGEKAVQTLHLVYMNLTNHFIIWPEQELNKGYSDLWMSPNLLNHPEMKYCYVVEFKYLRHEATDEEVAAKLAEAREQLRQYAGEGRLEAARRGTTLRRIAVVYRAWELAALEEVTE